MITRQTVGRHYPVKPLGDLVDFLDSQRRPITESDRRAGPFPYYGANGIQGRIDDYLFDEPLVLLAEDGGHFDQPDRGIAYRISGKSWVNNHAHVIRPRAGLDMAFLCRVLENYDVRPFISGTTRSKLTKGQAEKIGIPVPPLPEQRRIAAILDQADELRRKRLRAIASLEALPEAIFLQMFGNVQTNRRRLPVTSLSQVTECLDSRRRPVKASDRSFGTVPYFGANGFQGWIDKPIFNEPLVLVAEDGGHFDDPKRGVAYRVDGPAWVNNHAHILRAKRSVLDTEYLHRALRHYDFSKYITGTTRAKLTQQQMNQAEILLPSLPEQLVFGNRIRAIAAVADKADIGALALNNLFGSLQNRAFSGELTSTQAERELEMAS